MYFVFYHQDLLSKAYLKRLKVEPVSIKSSLINVSFHGQNMELTIDFLNRYLQAYLDDNLSKKNKIASSTIKFIDSQISNISDSLLKSESKLKDFRSANQVTDLSYQGQQALEQMTKIDDRKIFFTDYRNVIIIIFLTISIRIRMWQALPCHHQQMLLIL